MKQIVTVMTDFGTKDGYVGSMKGVLLSRAPDCTVVDITHEIPPFDIWSAAYTLLNYYQSFPENTVHLIVVDPGVGSERRALIVRTMRYFFVGPDNGVFDLVLKNEAYQAYEIKPERFGVHDYSSTFHGRDIFAPAAALLAKGTKVEDIAEQVNGLVRHDLKLLERNENECRANILTIDHFGNIIFALGKNDLKHWKKRIKSVTFKQFRTDSVLDFYAQGKIGEPMALWNSQNLLEIALPQGNAAKYFNLTDRNAFAVIQLSD